MRTSAREGAEFTTDSSDMKEMGRGNRCRGGGEAGEEVQMVEWAGGEEPVGEGGMWFAT